MHNMAFAIMKSLSILRDHFHVRDNSQLMSNILIKLFLQILLKRHSRRLDGVGLCDDMILLNISFAKQKFTFPYSSVVVYVMWSKKTKIQIQHFPDHLLHVVIEKVVHYKQLKNLIPGQVPVYFDLLDFFSSFMNHMVKWIFLVFHS